MTKVLVYGYAKALLDAACAFLPPGSVVVVEEPDLVARRGLADHAARCPVVARLVVAEHMGAAPAVPPGCADATGVLPGLEYGVESAAGAAELLGLPGATSGAARILRDKALLREATSAAGVPNPEWAEVATPGQARAAVTRFGGHAVLKPANRQASLGVQLLGPGDSVEEAWRRMTGVEETAFVPDRGMPARYLAERRLRGLEYSTEAFVRDGEIVFFNPTLKRVAPGPNPVEIGHVVPAPLGGPEAARLRELTARLVAATGYRTGVLHAEWIDDGGFHLVECAGRMPGDGIFDLVERAYGFSPVRAFVELMCGAAPTLPGAARAGAAVRFVTAPPGRVAHAEWPPYEGAECVLTARPGDVVGELRSSWDRLGHAVATGRTGREAEERVVKAVSLLSLRTEEEALR
ncbi:ATP-grasp domain-containing protein [Microbispora sp. H11081]|uniref:ATP-grasp domain-containing protein n=1 Tax=Microbispora sp. H11081 TaxID=2729107 RepID=UPI0014730107|nr:ATP-grasp domain-containing protein [Microbispora sp. H11081]